MGTDLSPSLLAEKLSCTPRESSVSPEDEVNRSPWLVWVTKGTYFHTFDVEFIETLALLHTFATTGRDKITR